MKIVHISDTHNRHKQIKWGNTDLSKVDVIVHSGDISGMGRRSEVEAFFKWWKVLPCQYKVLISGNHDLCFDSIINGTEIENSWDDNPGPHPHWLAREIKSYTDMYGHYYLENQGVEIEGVNFWGSPITPTFGYGWAFNKNRGADIKEVWDEIPSNTDVLITHGPPLHMGDYAEMSQVFVGCEDLRKRIKIVKPLLHLCGHIHEGYGYAYDEDTNYFNGSICNLHGYEPVNSPWIIDADFKEREIKILNYENEGKESGESK